ncbi:MAG: FtsW/RodA/SpoVE family cell cycle protein [Firmicutes bacterium]|nr:FtsW/RodA/SpoVE family cell cycle protein [Bacillota bacterium]
MSEKRILNKIDFTLLSVVLLMVIFGIIMIGSAGGWELDLDHFSIGPIMTRQFLGLCLGLIATFIILFMSRELLKFLSVPAYLGMLFLLVLVLLVGVGTTDAGEEADVRRWLPFIGGFNLQPSEFAKFFMIVSLSRFCDLRSETINKPATLAIYAVLLAVPVLLVMEEPDLSTSIVMLCIGAAILFCSGLDWRYIATAIFVVAIALYVILSDAYSPDGPKILTDYQATRIWAFFDPESYSQDYAYQTLRSKYAISSGGLMGLGLFNGNDLVPVPMTDFLFGILGEELGFLGASCMFALLTIMICRILWIASKAQDLFGKLICVGVATWIAMQSFIHIGVTTAVLPNTGIPLPFMSYGLSSLVSNMAGIGLVMHVYAGIRTQTTKYKNI